MIAEKSEPAHLGRMVTQAVKLSAGAVVDVEVLVLRYSEHRVVPKKAKISYRLPQLDLMPNATAVPLDDGDVTFASS